jgi:D-arabinose 1-dehydrogenase-like Zn-dependent alcohol dehydrogenase
MSSIRVEEAKGPFKIFDEKITEPARGQVRIKVQACGVCHSDVFTKEGVWPGITYPRSPGHEIAGVVEASSTGKWESASASDGMAGTAFDASRVGAAISSIAAS